MLPAVMHSTAHTARAFDRESGLEFDRTRRLSAITAELADEVIVCAGK